MLNKTCLPIGVAMAALMAPAANATIVQFQTVLGTFEVNLYDQSTPATVANFLGYVNAGAYDNAVFHRVVNGFVAQGGGYTYEGTETLAGIAQNPPVVNEPRFSNVRGTIAMAKLSGNANSATNQWFINLGDNSANLDAQNGGFTVFGQVIGNGMDVLDAINALPKFNFGSSFDTIPLRDYTTQNATDGVEITDRHLVLVTAIVVIDGAANTAAGLSPVANTLINQPTTPPAAPSGGGGGGGAMGFGSLLMLGLLGILRRRRDRSSASAAGLRLG
jgi:peptidyl-prolyl cis-trans isomerase A (cyclophilin A)